jgi:CheY-like chemotaxis protein
VRQTVLVVDDDAPFRQLAIEVLAGWGHPVIGEAGTVSEALERVTQLGPDIVLADVGLPDGDGFALARTLVSMPNPPRVILTSSDSDVGNRQVANRSGALAFVPKDELDGTELRELLARG